MILCQIGSNVSTTTEKVSENNTQLSSVLSELVLDSKEPVDNVPFRRRFQDYVLRLSVVPCPKCCFCGDSVYNAALICTNTGRDNLDRNSKYPSVDTSGCTMKTDVKRRRVRLRTPGAEATKINDSPFVCLNCRYRYNCPVSDSPCGGEVILWRFSLAHLSLILAMLCDTVIDSNILISQHATNYLTKLILQYPRSSEMLDHIKAASHALQKWELWVHKGEHVTYPSEDEQEDTIDDRIGKIGLSTKARFLVASLTWIYILNANFPSGPNSPSAPNSPNSQSAPNSPSAVDCEGNPNIIEQLRANYPLLLGKPKKKPFSFNNDDPEDE